MSHWSNKTHQAIKKMMEDLSKLKNVLMMAITSLKYSLPMLHLLPEQQNELIQVVLLAVEQLRNIQTAAQSFTKYLKKEDQYIIETLTTSEQLMTSLQELLTSPGYLEFSSNQQNDDI